MRGGSLRGSRDGSVCGRSASACGMSAFVEGKGRSADLPVGRGADLLGNEG